MIRHHFYVYTSPSDLLVDYFRKKGYPDAGKHLITDLFDIKAAGHIKIELATDKSRLDIVTQGLSPVVAIAQIIRAGIGCQAVRLAWLWGAGVVSEDQTLIAEFSRKCSDRIALEITRKAYLARGHSEEEVQGFVEDIWHTFHDEDTDNESLVRARLHAAWQDVAIHSKDFPDEATLRKEPVFAQFFDMGFKVKKYGRKARADMVRIVAEIQGNGLSYTDLEKAKAYLREIPGEPWEAHAERIDQFFKNAPASLLGDVRAFLELMPVAHGRILEYAADQVRSSVEVGRLAAKTINGFPSGYFFLMGSVKSDLEVIGAALLADRQGNRNWLPPKSAARIKQHVDKLHQLLDEASALEPAVVLSDAQLVDLRTEMLSGAFRFEDMKPPLQDRFKDGYEAALRLIGTSLMNRPLTGFAGKFLDLIHHAPFSNEGDADRLLWLVDLVSDLPVLDPLHSPILLIASGQALQRYMALKPEDVGTARFDEWRKSADRAMAALQAMKAAGPI